MQSAPPPPQLALYHYEGCYWCHLVRRELDRLGTTVELRDIHTAPANRAELVEATGRKTVPVLRIEHTDGDVEWLPESRDIIDYLRELHAPKHS